MKHRIYDHELKAIKDASDCLFQPDSDSKMDDRSAYQQIYYILEEIQNREW